MRPPVPEALRHLSPRQLGQAVRATGTWMAGTAGGSRGSLRHAGGRWVEAEPVRPEQWYRELLARPAEPLSVSIDGAPWAEPVPQREAELELEAGQ
jgi:hypothetical protein